MIHETIEYKSIVEVYGDDRAKRSGVRLMNHIDEGIEILDRIGASYEAKLAFCIHPIAQNGDSVEFSSVKVLAEEYAYFANKFLCKPETDHVRDLDALETHLHSDIDYRMSNECRDMLIADKEQNRKDFLEYHYGTHVRSSELYAYFELWLKYLYQYSH